MRLSWNEIRARAADFAREWADGDVPPDVEFWVAAAPWPA